MIGLGSRSSPRLWKGRAAGIGDMVAGPCFFPGCRCSGRLGRACRSVAGAPVVFLAAGDHRKDGALPRPRRGDARNESRFRGLILLGYSQHGNLHRRGGFDRERISLDAHSGNNPPVRPDCRPLLRNGQPPRLCGRGGFSGGAPLPADNAATSRWVAARGRGPSWTLLHNEQLLLHPGGHIGREHKPRFAALAAAPLPGRAVPAGARALSAAQA